MSLRIYAKLIGSKTIVERFSPKNLEPSDVVVIAVKDNYDPRDLLADEKYPSWFPVDVRTVGFYRDLPLIRNVCTTLQGFQGNVVVVTNPLDIFTTLVKYWLPKATVVGLGVSLDAARLYYKLAEHGISLGSWHSCPLAGEHGKRMVVLESLWKKPPAKLGLDKDALAKVLAESLETGPKIVAGLGYTLDDCVVAFTEDIRWICGITGARRFLFASYGDSKSATGQPLFMAKGHIMPFTKLTAQESGAILSAKNNNAEVIKKIMKHEAFMEYIH
jgi:hypothetical protein